MPPHRSLELVAPSGYPPDQAVVHRALARLRAGGWEIHNARSAARRYLRFAGTDAERAADLNRLADPNAPLPDLVLAVRGGYGAARLLHGLDYDGLRQRLTGQAVTIVGHSDFTAIQMALLARAGLTTFGGPMLWVNFGAETPSSFTLHHFVNTLSSPRTVVRGEVPQRDAVEVSGTLWGGNLAVITSLVGTPYLPSINGGILFLEDVNEYPFRVERMLYQLYLSGILARQQALVLGAFSGGLAGAYENGFGLAAIIKHLRSVVGIPVITGLQFGHVENMLTLPVGAPAHLVAGAEGFTLTVSDYPYWRE